MQPCAVTSRCQAVPRLRCTGWSHPEKLKWHSASIAACRVLKCRPSSDQCLYVNDRLTAAGQLSSSCGSWEPDWRRWVVMPGPSPNSESHWGRSALTWTELSPDSPGAPPMQRCLRCRHSGRSPWSVWTDRWTSGWRKCQGGMEGGRNLILGTARIMWSVSH